MNNPPWVNRLVSENLDRIAAAAKSHDLPMPVVQSGKIVSEELGGGHYGVVYKTERPGIVFKVTSDEDEAHFVATALTLAARDSHPVAPEGIVQYFAIYALPGSYRGRKTYVLWREEASKVGLPVFKKTYDENEFEKLLMRFKVAAHNAKLIADQKAKKLSSPEYWDWMSSQLSQHDKMVDEYGEHWGDEAPSQYGIPRKWLPYDAVGEAIMKRHVYSGRADQNRFAWLVSACSQISMEMANANGMAYLIGQALGEYLEEGILLADVHGANVGLVDRFKYAYVITDPGHAVVLKESLSAIEIPVV